MNEVTFPYQTIKFNEQQYKIVTDSKLENKKLILSELYPSAPPSLKLRLIHS